MNGIRGYGLKDGQAVFLVEGSDGDHKWLDASELNDLVIHLYSEEGPHHDGPVS